MHCKKMNPSNNRKSTGSSLHTTLSINFMDISVNSKTQCNEV